MDVSLAKAIKTPKGSLKRILKDDVIIWEKTDGPKYNIRKNGVSIAQVTMNEFVDAVRSEYAKQKWGLGAQLVVPYKDPFNNITYELPFDFVNFRSGRVRLQTHYAIPSCGLTYGTTTSKYNNYCSFSGSYIRKWLNSRDTSHGITISPYAGKRGFLGCLPSDFVAKIDSFVLPNAREVNADTEKFRWRKSTTYVYDFSFDTSPTTAAWDYWANRITSPDRITGGNGLKRAVFPIGISSTKETSASNAASIVTTTKVTQSIVSGYTYYYLFGFNKGSSELANASSQYKYTPSCLV